MGISRHNYEKYFLDYIEGNLEPEVVAELMLFLSQNPDLEKELQEFEEITLVPENMTFSGKDTLHRPDDNLICINDKNFEEYCVAGLEGDLSHEKAGAFDTYLRENPEKQNEYDLFIRTILKPDNSIVFEDKRSLKRYTISVKRSRIVYFLISAAASVIILLSVIYILRNDNNNDTILVADNKTGDNSIIQDNIVQEDGDEKTATTETSSLVAESTDPIISGQENKNDHNNQVINSENEEEKMLAGNNYTITRINTDQVFIDDESATQHEITGTIPVMTRPVINEYENELVNLNSDIETGRKDRLDLKNISVWDIAGLSVKGLQKFTGWDVHINNEYDENGKVKTLAFNAEGIGFSTNLKNN